MYNTLGLKDNKVVRLKLYPNPVTNSFQILSHANIEQVYIYNMMGVLVKNVRNSKIVNLKDLSSGSYIVSVQTDQGLYKQIIVKK